MSTDEYMPSDEDAVDNYVAGRGSDDPGLSLPELRAEYGPGFDRFLARVRRDAARAALDGLMHRFELEQGHAAAHHRGLDAQRAKLARMTTEAYRDTRYPEETP